MLKSLLSAGLMVVCVAAPNAARGQSLADVSKNTEDQRKSARPSLGVYTNRSLGGAAGYESLLDDKFLLADHFGPYSRAHAGIVDLRIHDRQLDDYLVRCEYQAKDRFDLEQAYRQDTSIVQTLQVHQIDVRTYFMTDAAYSRALRDQQLSKSDRDQLPEGRRLNAKYVEDKSLTHWLKYSPEEQRLESLHQARAR